MSRDYIVLSLWQVGLAALLLGVNLALSIALRLGLHKTLLVASVRMTAQLLLVGYVLEWIFRLDAPGPVLLVALVMTVLAGVSAVDRTNRRYAGIWWDSLVAVLGSSFVVTGFALAGVLRVRPWYDAQYLVPLLGMVLGNTLNGITLALDHFMEGLATRRAAVESLLALGATRWEAAHQEIRDAIRRGMIPTLNSMAVMGVVSLPGMMTGQILGGALPVDAVRYQILIMFMIAAATALGMLATVMLAFRALFDTQHRLRAERLRRKT